MTDAEGNSAYATPVPAVSRAVRILTVLGQNPAGATLSEITKEAKLSKSTTANLLRTMVLEGLLVQEADGRRFGFGPRLMELGTLAAGRARPLVAARPYMASLSEETGLACLAIKRMDDGRFLAVEKIESRKDIKVTINQGERFPEDSPLLSRVWDAWSAPAHASHPKRYTDATLTRADDMRKAREAIREQGFGSVRGEYIANLNVVGFPVFGADAQPQLLIALLGIGDDLAAEHVSQLAPELVRAARAVTAASGGILPEGYPGQGQPTESPLVTTAAQ
jgi:DNA-binding IclR family transcriptional regulator